ncbi:unnamed protein product [Rhizophagus irregularis]|nr:unnamed protein product [Rhizophagus irregularis]
MNLTCSNYVEDNEVSNGNDLKIIMTGIEELKDLDVNNTEHYKRINIKPSLEDENYEVFGSVISKNNSRLEDILFSFELYDSNGFSAIIRTLNNADIDIAECYILWMIIGSPSKLSVFSPRDRELQVHCVKKSITLQPNCSYYPIKTCKLFQGYAVSVNVYCSTANSKPINIKINIVGWSEYYIYFKITKSNYNNSNSDSSSDSSESHDQPDGDTNFLTNFEIAICILSSNYENFNVDNREEKEVSLGLIGHCLTEDTKVIPFTNVDELGSDQIKYLQEMESCIKKIENETEVYQLKLANYEMDRNVIPRKNGSVCKWVNIEYKNEEFAFRSISNKEYQMIIQNQATILKQLHVCDNIIKFYGLTSNVNKWYLVTEWAEYGNLREFYTNHKDRFNLKLKLRMSFDIACGLNFLGTVEMLHRDIRAENVLVTFNETAKLANFKLSRYLTAATLNQKQNLKRVCYCAPELLERAPNYKYDQRCEVYSFGILLWEIAEEKTPYKNYKDVIETDFSENNQMPVKFKNLVINAINHDPEFRPKITEMLEVLKVINNCSKESKLVPKPANIWFSRALTGTAMIVILGAKLSPIYNEIGIMINEINELAEAAEHNKQICKILKNRVCTAETVIRNFKERKNRETFFNRTNYMRLQDLHYVLIQIKDFISKISQLKSLIRFIEAKNLEKIFKGLCEEFDSCINFLSFSIEIKIAGELGHLKADQVDLFKHLKEIETGVKKIDDKVFQNQETHSLKLSDYVQDDNEKPRKNGSVSKWVNVKNKNEEFAFKSISNKEYQMTIQNQVAILKKLHGCNNIIKFYGLLPDGNKWYLATEWAEYGNLREFYTNHKDRFNLILKLRISIDIAHGLNFLRTVEILHHDIRAENVLITINNTAKLASRSLYAVTLKQDQNLEQVRYCAPELLKNSNFKYDHKCEVYSFGILLLEIAEERTPYQNYKDVIEIINLVSKKYREPFSENSQMSENFKNLVINAFDHNPGFRPKISEMLKVLNNCLEDSEFKAFHNISNVLQNQMPSETASTSAVVSIDASAVAGDLVIIPFPKFLPIINEIGNIFNEIFDLVEAAEHNKQICKKLQKRVRAAELAIQDLIEIREDRKDFFNKMSYMNLRELRDIIDRIKKFISKISQMKFLVRCFQEENIKKTFKELCEEFDSCINFLSFSVNIKITDELGQLRAKQDYLFKYILGMGDGIKKIGDLGDDTNLSKKFSLKAEKVNAMSNTIEKIMNKTSQNQTKIDNIFQIHPLKLSDYKQDDDEKPRKNGSVIKWYKIKNKCEEFAFKSISDKEDQRIVQNQVTILKEIHDWQNIIKLYGAVLDGNKWYLVTEWAEHGNLREFYTNHKDRFNLRLKLRMSLDIARGLNFLGTVEMLHRDIRAENVLVTFNETAKLANFKLSRHVTAKTLNLNQTLERVRYCAPELLERAPNDKYNQKCEVYSFGILLWEIAEERIPYQGNDDILDIADKVHNKMCREPFSKNSQMPEKFKQLEIEAVHQVPDFRPNITKMFDVLRDCVRDLSSSSGP